MKGSGRSETSLIRTRRGESLGQVAWGRFRRNVVAMGGLVILLLVGAVTLLAPQIAPYDPLKSDYQHLKEGPSDLHWWGTDDLGRDIFSRVIWGGRDTLSVGILAVLVGLAAGTLIGLVSGTMGGWLDEVVQRLVDVFLAFPSILLMLSIVTIFGRGLTAIILAVGMAFIPITTRFVRGNVLTLKNQDYVDAARSLGTRTGRIMLRHILPNAVAPLVVFTSMLLGGAVLITAGLNYIGLGAKPPSPEWGAMLNYGRSFLTYAWWMSVFPGLAIFLVSLSINMLGEGLREALDPTARE